MNLTLEHPGIAGLHAEPFAWLPDLLFRIKHNGGDWTAATDGRMLLAVEGSGDPFPPPKRVGITGKKIEITLQTPVSSSFGTMETYSEVLKEFVGEVHQAEKIPCESCCGEGMCECPRCEDTHKCCCCKGGGMENKYSPRYCKIGGKLFDANRISRLLEHVSGPCSMTIHTNGKEFSPFMLRMAGAGWEAWLVEIANSDNSPIVFENLSKDIPTLISKGNECESK